MAKSDVTAEMEARLREELRPHIDPRWESLRDANPWMRDLERRIPDLSKCLRLTFEDGFFAGLGACLLLDEPGLLKLAQAVVGPPG